MSRFNSKHDIYFILLLIVLFGLMFLIPGLKSSQDATGFRANAKVLSTDNSVLSATDIATGETLTLEQKSDPKQMAGRNLIFFGSQHLTVCIKSGFHKGETFQAGNELRAQMELDKFFVPGDRVVVVSPKADIEQGDILLAQDYARNIWTYALFFAFCVLLCIFGRLTGFNALLSFVFSCLLIWKVVIPLVLRGWPASWTIFACVVFLTAVIMYLVAGFTTCGICAFCGATSGIFVGLFTAHFFTRVMQINGAVLPFSQTLLSAGGYPFLDLRDIFVGAMILASSGAVMDLGMDISSGMEEVARHNPTVSRLELMRSGLRMGRNVVGTMTTTLLLAYSGGYITLLMMFAAQGTSPTSIINNPLVATEIVKTLIGSFSLVLVAPFTAIFGSWLFKRKANAVPNTAKE